MEGPGTGVSKHGGSSVSFVTSNERLTRASERTLTVNDLYLHLHTENHDEVTFIDTRSARFYAQLECRRQELTQATPDQPVDEMALYYDVVGCGVHAKPVRDDHGLIGLVSTTTTTSRAVAANADGSS
ncbi:hypothetical protein Sjap_005133 [Stephania japonica]|uniref:Uncharacterized protein n=1 Tax=Stephania japonica TaxID=461633 RepID=A0AAP0K5W2_9MAGN